MGVVHYHKAVHNSNFATLRVEDLNTTSWQDVSVYGKATHRRSANASTTCVAYSSELGHVHVKCKRSGTQLRRIAAMVQALWRQCKPKLMPTSSLYIHLTCLCSPKLLDHTDAPAAAVSCI